MSEEKEKEKEKLGPFRNPCSIEITLGSQKSHFSSTMCFLGFNLLEVDFYLAICYCPSKFDIWGLTRAFPISFLFLVELLLALFRCVYTSMAYSSPPWVFY